MAATAPGAGTGTGAYQKCMAEALKRFSRSIELCDDYLRGYYGLKLVSWLRHVTQQQALILFKGHNEASQRRSEACKRVRRGRILTSRFQDH